MTRCLSRHIPTVMSQLKGGECLELHQAHSHYSTIPWILHHHLKLILPIIVIIIISLKGA